MRIQELITNSNQIEEGWKDTLGNLAIAGAIGAGSAGGMAIKKAFDTQHDPVAHQVSAQSTPSSVSQQAKTAGITQAAKQVAKKVVVTPITDNSLEHILLASAKRAGLAGAELAAFMSQCAHESANFSSLSEVGNSSSFKKYDPKFSPKLAKILGNKFRGDGERYKGRGFIQLTGRWNYKIAGEALGIPLEEHPELASKPDVAAKIAIWYWKTRVSSKVDNFYDVASVTKFINSGLHGLMDRKTIFNAYIKSATKHDI